MGNFMRTDFVKVINPGKVKVFDRLHEVFVRIEFKGGELILRGVIGPRHNGNCAGDCGQIVGKLRDIQVRHRGWRRYGDIEMLQEYWSKYHLNHMHAGCRHQDVWDTAKELTLPDGWTGPAGRVCFDGHPEGLLHKPCPVCGHKYGTEWKKRRVPRHVLDWLRGLPDAERDPVWV
jgi:hypothetical protein